MGGMGLRVLTRDPQIVETVKKRSRRAYMGGYWMALGDAERESYRLESSWYGQTATGAKRGQTLVV